MQSKRYTIFNKHVGGSNRLPQGFHVLNRLWATKDNMSKEAQKTLQQWAVESEIEVVLMGGTDSELETLFEAVNSIPEIPSAKFNEPDMRDACMAITFVATDRIVVGSAEVRNRRIPSFETIAYLLDNEVSMPDGSMVKLTPAEVTVAASIAYLRLAD